MTSILVKRLREEYPRARISVEGAYEIVSLDLIGPEFDPTKLFKSDQEIERIARGIFDVPFKYESRCRTGPAIFFEPERVELDYHRNHLQHHLWVILPQYYPEMEISTGWRGKSELMNLQRENYLRFISQVRCSFVANAKK